MRKVVFRCVTGGYDTPNLFPIHIEDGWEYIFLTDSLDAEIPEGWEPVLINNEEGLDKIRLARRAKILYWEYIGQADLVIWVDGNVKTKIPFSVMVNDLLSPDKQMIAKAHDVRICAYKEAAVCASIGKGKPFDIARQVSYYQSLGFERDYGLIESWSLIRRDTPEIRSLMEMWWDQVKTFSTRDQIGFDFCRWSKGMDPFIEYIQPDIWHSYLERRGYH